MGVSMSKALCLALTVVAGAASAMADERTPIPQARAGHGDGVTATLTGATERYRHCVLGDCIEASALRITERNGATHVIDAGTDAVFEDLEPQVVDLDGDRQPEVLVIRSRLAAGAALAVIGRRDGAWRILAETPPIGIPNRWLNRAGVADFDGDGRKDIALVVTPHLAGRVQIWRFRQDGSLTLLAERAGYSNHAIGSEALDLAAIADLNRDGRPELVLPTLDRRALAVLAVGAVLEERARHPLPGRAVAGLALGRERGGWLARVRLEDGRIAEVGLSGAAQSPKAAR